MTAADVAFGVLVVLFGGYVLLDGYDLGIGAMYPLAGRSAADRAALMRSIGPFWNANEVWLIAGGAALFALFPRAYAVSFSGFYLPFMVVLWLLMFRGIALELRGSLASDVWRTLWDAAFAGSSALLALFFGVALGNLLRGLDLNPQGYFFGTFAALLNPYALGAGIFALLALSMHGMLYGAMRIEEPLGTRCLTWAKRLWWAVLAAFFAQTAATFVLYHAVDQRRPFSLLVTLAALGSLAAVRLRIGRPRTAFLASCAFLAMLILAAASTMFPYLVTAYPRGSGGITIYDAAPPAGSLTVILVLALAGLGGLAGYRTAAAVRVSVKIEVSGEAGHS